MRWRRAGAVLFPLAFGISEVQAQGVEGRVLDASTSAPVAGALVALVDSLNAEVARALSDSAGAFHLAAPSRGWFRLRARRIGYTTTRTDEFELRRAETLQVQLHMAHDAIPLEPLTVTGRVPRRPTRLEAAGFNERRRFAQGFFMDREQIEKTNARDMASMLRQAPGIQLVQSPRAHGPTVRIHRGGSCLPAVYLDGLYIGEGAEELHTHLANDAEAVEVYTSPIRVPAMFRTRRASCGAILIWTRDR
jgi:hypothetical protein